MQETHCPVCFGELAPCDDCGAKPEELEHFHEGRHVYQVFAVFPGLELTLCDFCMVDFDSYDPEFFGLPKRSPLGLGRMVLVAR